MFLKQKKYLIPLLVFLSLLLIGLIYFLVVQILGMQKDLEVEIESPKTDALMLLIEFEDTVGLNNMVFQMKERDIPGVLLVSPDFVEYNCEFVKGLQENNIEIAGVYPNQPLWDIEYDDQLAIINDVKVRIEECTGTGLRAFGSRYFAYDENTLKAADELGLEYVFARGTTGARATIYKAKEYDVKIFSVSNVDSENWGTGSLCDYSYWAREGTPEDFDDELELSMSKYDKVSPVSHTYLGGGKVRWNDVYLKLFDMENVNWLDLDTFGVVDFETTFREIPDNREVKYDTPHPAIPLDDEEGVANPCGVVEIDTESKVGDISDVLTIFHNGSGPMCIEAISFLEENDIEYFQVLNTDADYAEKLSMYKSEVINESVGMSTSFSYYPIIFYKGVAFSGFNDDIGNEIMGLK